MGGKNDDGGGGNGYNKVLLGIGIGAAVAFYFLLFWSSKSGGTPANYDW